jgi:signal transduction histidine kinase
MQVGIVLPIVVAIGIAVAVAVDTAVGQEAHDSPGELAAGQERDAGREVAGQDRGGDIAAGHADRESAGTSPGAPRKASRFALRNWSVRSRLILLVAVPSLTAIVLAVARIVSLLQSPALAHGTGAARGRAATSAAVESLLFVLLLAIAVAVMAIVGRSMVRPLRRLQAGALEVARLQLPETVRLMNEGASAPEVVPIDVHSSDEIGDVARAFDQVHREAIRLAGNEAALRGNVNDMFVNLSRRSQSLVTRQIRLIDDLEQGEQDPERLGSLFQMDHLATRMRRNSENLLVLAGHEEARRWNEPLALVDVLRASLSEVEQYERVTLDVQPGIVVRGRAVSDVVHLIAELVENATSFSAVETPVRIAGHLLNSGGALLEITDHGVGMQAAEMAGANWRLDNPPTVDVSVSRRMGLFVVARLAARHGIRVRLRSTEAAGLVALVWLPDETIMGESPDAAMRDPGFAALRAEPGTGGAAAGLTAPARFAPLRVDEARTGPIPAVAAEDTGLVAAEPPGDEPGVDTGQARSWPDSAAGVAGLAAAPLGDVPPPDTARDLPGPGPAAGVAVPAAAGTEQANRLPIFESVESDWFRRGGKAAVAGFGRDRPGGGGAAAASDEGWQAAETVLAPASTGLTDAGLPKRAPGANLVPGTAADASTAGAEAPIRSATATRDRLASFQRGMRQGRAAVGGAPGGENDPADGGDAGSGSGA